jgi:hypothetical protein
MAAVLAREIPNTGKVWISTRSSVDQAGLPDVVAFISGLLIHPYCFN